MKIIIAELDMKTTLFSLSSRYLQITTQIVGITRLVFISTSKMSYNMW